jgi:hypothetical protein
MREFDPANAYKKPPVNLKIIPPKLAVIHTSSLHLPREAKIRPMAEKKSGTDSDAAWEEYLELVRVFKEARRTFPFIFLIK